MNFRHFTFFLIAMSCVCVSALAQTAATTSTSITLDDAIRRAQNADTAYATAVTEAGVAAAQRGIARSALLPGVVYHNQYLYTQGEGSTLNTPASSGQSQPAVRFIANNAIHEYLSQGIVTENIGGAAIGDYRKSAADAAGAEAGLEEGRRGPGGRGVSTY